MAIKCARSRRMGTTRRGVAVDRTVHSTRRECYTSRVLHIESVTRRECYTSRVLHVESVTRRECYTSRVLHVESVTRRECYTSRVLHVESVTRRECYTSRVLHVEVWTCMARIIGSHSSRRGRCEWTTRTESTTHRWQLDGVLP